MSAKKKGASAPGRKPGNPSASPADGRKRQVKEEDWNFSALLNAYRKTGQKADSDEGRELIAAALYEYARESEWFRKLCSEMERLEMSLTEKYGRGWDDIDAEEIENEPVAAPGSIHPSMFDPLYSEYQELKRRFEELETHMVAGPVLLRRLRDDVAANKPWLCIKTEDRLRVIQQAWKNDDTPRWISEVETQTEPERWVRKGEHSWLAFCGPADPREMLELAQQDEEEDARLYREECQNQTKGQAAQRRADAIAAKWEGRGLRNEVSPNGQEVIAFSLNWSLTDEEMQRSFFGLLKTWRPEAWKDFAKRRQANLSPDNALIGLAAYRYDPASCVDMTREDFWTKLSHDKVQEASRLSNFSKKKAAAERRLREWELLACQTLLISENPQPKI